MLLLEVNSISDKKSTFRFRSVFRNIYAFQLGFGVDGGVRKWMNNTKGGEREMRIFNGQKWKIICCLNQWNSSLLFLLFARINEEVGRKLYCCVYFWLKRWKKEEYTTIECLSAPTRNCGRRDRNIKNILFGSSVGRWQGKDY